MMAIDTAIWLAGIAGEAVLVGLLIWKREYRSLPFFFAYVLWALIVDCGMLILHAASSKLYVPFYVVEVPLDSLLQYGILVELSWSVLRPFRASLPRWIVPGISVTVAVLAACAWPFANIKGFVGLPANWPFLLHLEQVFAILRILFFLVLAAGSHALSIGWRDRELQVATGLGIFSLVSLAGAIVHTHQVYGANFKLVYRFIAISYLCSLLYWLYSFAHKQATRREFTPQMQELLLSLAGSARAQRAEVAEYRNDMTSKR